MLTLVAGNSVMADFAPLEAILSSDLATNLLYFHTEDGLGFGVFLYLPGRMTTSLTGLKPHQQTRKSEHRAQGVFACLLRRIHRLASWRHFSLPKVC